MCLFLSLLQVFRSRRWDWTVTAISCDSLIGRLKILFIIIQLLKTIERFYYIMFHVLGLFFCLGCVCGCNVLSVCCAAAGSPDAGGEEVCGSAGFTTRIPAGAERGARRGPVRVPLAHPRAGRPAAGLASGVTSVQTAYHCPP